MTSVHIVVHGTPAAQGSKKHVGGGRMVEMDKKLPSWRAAVEAAARLATGPGWAPLDGPLKVSGHVSLRKPNTTKFPTAPAGVPDLDKLQRAIGDALTKAGTIKDDARIVHWDIRKVWADNVPGANLTITQEPS
ncbi:RusA-like Holliday junction resolvase [Arthrobacter phage Persistence]|uniref:RusA-like resolvase n=1 Tax=Arthrobacter phage Persistence TaxID=2836007 RepID=A0A8F3E1J9_9CAUD|nr:RusA-like Holliday junction resolvase [Arthrobacter phage Persistence]QWY79707.1 RusA-like resolvase [Arthrobacter phage Persistence]